MSSNKPSPSNQAPGDIYVVGLSHKTAPAEVREKMALLSNSPEIIAEVKKHTNAQEAILLSTCNRSELYFYSEKLPDLKSYLLKKTNISELELDKYLFTLEGRDAISHLYRVASGLDSLVIGEPQILGQLKNAYRSSKINNGVGSILERSFQSSFAVAKHIRNNTGIGKNPISVAYAGAQLTKKFFDDHNKRTALIIGAGETGTLVAKYLKGLNTKRIIIANRTFEKGQALAQEVDGYAIDLSEVEKHLFEADMIFGTAQAEKYLINYDAASQSMKKRSHALQVYVDLGMPRNFDDRIDKISDIFLYGIDDLEQIIDHNKSQRRQAANQAEAIIQMFTDDFIDWLNAKPQHEIIKHFRAHADDIRQELLKESYRKLAHGEDPAKIMDELSYKLTKKLLHRPSAMINAIPPNHKDWLAIIADTFETESHH